MSQTIELKITGMTCGHCVGHVKNALQNVEGVTEARVDLATGRAIVTGQELNTRQLVEAVEEEGYEAAPSIG
jgi:copper chaperone CopZ